VAAVALGVTPSLAPADRRHSGASRSVGDLLVMGPNRSGAATSLGDREKSGDKVYSEFGQPRRQASRSAPDVLSLPVATISTQGSRDTSAMSMASHVSVLPWSEFAYLTVSPPESVSAPSIPNSTPSPTHSPTLPSATPATVHTGTLVTPHLPQGVQRMPAQGAVANLDSSDEDGDMSLVSPGRRRFQWTR
jgi:hypothetical protein